MGWILLFVAITCGVILLFMFLGIDFDHGFIVPVESRALFRNLLIAATCSTLAGLVTLYTYKSFSKRNQMLTLRLENGSFILESKHLDETTVVARNLKWHELQVYEERIYSFNRHDHSYTTKWTLQLRVWSLERQYVFHESFDGIMDSCMKVVNGEPHNAHYISAEPGTLSRFAGFLKNAEVEKPAEIDLLGFRSVS